MIFGRTIILGFLCFVFRQVESQASDSLVTEYYEIPGCSYIILPQDDIDAQAIIDDKMSEKIFASIIPYRDECRRTTIIRQIGLLSEKEYIEDWYIPQVEGTTPFQDLVYGFMKGEITVTGGFLHEFSKRKDEPWITIALVLTKNMIELMNTYGTYLQEFFEDLIKIQRPPFQDMLRVWVKQNREAIEQGDLDQNKVKKDADDLKAEYDNGGWHEKHEQIERALVKKSIKYVRAVIQEFEKTNGGKLIEDIIKDSIEKHHLDQALANVYASLTRYIKDKHQYTADIMRQYSDGSDKWGIWILCIAVTSPQEWPFVNKAFQKDHKDDTLSKFIMQKLTNDKVMAEMMAVIVDPSFKPTTFTKKPVQKGDDPAAAAPG